MRASLGLILATVMAVPLGTARGQQQGSGTRPNVVILFTDDMGYGDLSSYGNPTIRTPNIDKMARDGIRLTSFYASASVCTPSRFGLLTGRYAIRAGLTAALLHDAKVGIPPGEVTMAEALKTRGYQTSIVGKWHLGDRPEFNPTRHGFDTFFGLPYSNDIMPPWVAGAPPVPLLSGTSIIEQPAEQTTLTSRYTTEAIRRIREAQNQPFFLYVAYNMPHLPISTSEKFRGTSGAGRYGDVIQELDWSVGEILAALRAANLDRKTLVVFMSDNGPWLNAGPRMMQGGVDPWDVGSPGSLRGSKGTSYEGGFRVPAIMRWTGTIPPGQESAAIASNLDLFPTVLQMAGVSLPPDRPIDGRDILPLLTKRAAPAAREFFYFVGGNVEAVREGRWKFRLAAAGRGQPLEPELYNLDVDPSERYNVAKDQPGLAARLGQRLQAFAADVKNTPR